MSLYKGAKTKVKVGTHLSEELVLEVGVHQGSPISPLWFAIGIDVVTNEIKEGMSQEILYADDIVLIAETKVKLPKKNYTWKSALESKGVKVNLVKTKVMVSVIGQISLNPCSKKDQCGICGRKTMVNAVLCKSSLNWIHGSCAKINKGKNTLTIDLKCRKCRWCHKNAEALE